VPRTPKMTAAVTHLQLRNELEAFESRVDSQFGQLRTELDHRFESIDRRFESIDRQFESIDRQFESIDRQFESIDRRFEAIDRRFDAIDRRFEAIDQRFEAIDQRLDRCATRDDLEIWAGALEQRLEHRLEQRLEAWATTITTTFSAELARHTRAIEESALGAVRALDDKYADHPARLAALERKVGV
jgi:chromosome segregation ATPase